MCENIWSGGFCRWDCEVLETFEDVMNMEKTKMWTIKSNDPSVDRWDGCHYYCYSQCTVCNQMPKILTCGGPLNGKCPEGYSCKSRAQDLFGVCVDNEVHSILFGHLSSPEHIGTIIFLSIIGLIWVFLILMCIYRQYNRCRQTQDPSNYVLIVDE